MIPPIQCLPARSDDEAASDPPDMPSKVGQIWIFQLQGLKSLERDRERERGREPSQKKSHATTANCRYQAAPQHL